MASSRAVCAHSVPEVPNGRRRKRACDRRACRARVESRLGRARVGVPAASGMSRSALRRRGRTRACRALDFGQCCVTMERSRDAPAGVGLSRRAFHARVHARVACCRGAIVKMFATARRLPHVRARSSNPALTMLSVPAESPPVRALEAGGKPRAGFMVKHWESLAREGTGRLAPAARVTLPPNGSASS